LSPYANTLPWLNEGHLGTNSESFPNDFYQMLVYEIKRKVQKSTITMTNAEREVLLAPATADCMNITCADSASFNLNVNVIITKRFWLKLVLVEFGPGIRPIDLEACECLWITHYEIIKRN
jgi:hypothetical protein